MIQYELDGVVFLKAPTRKHYTRKLIGFRGDRTPVLPPTWTLELEFGVLAVASGTVTAMMMDAWQAETHHSAFLPHPTTGVMTTFSGVSVSEFEYSFADVDRDRWGDGGKVTISNIDLGLSW